MTAAAVVVMTANSLSGARLQDGAIAHQVAQSGADNALIRILRSPSYTGETLQVGSGSATITVSGSGSSSDPYVVTSSGNVRNFIKKVEVRATYQNNQLSVLSQKELF